MLHCCSESSFVMLIISCMAHGLFKLMFVKERDTQQLFRALKQAINFSDGYNL